MKLILAILFAALPAFGQADYLTLAALTPVIPGTNAPAEWTYAMAFNSFAKTNTTAGADPYLAEQTTLPPANSLMLVAVGNTKASAPDMPTLTGCGVEWVNIGTTNWSAAFRLTLFRGMTNGTPTTNALRAAFGANQTGCNIAGTYWCNANTNGWGSGAIVQVVLTTNNSANPSVTLAALQGATNGVFCVFENNINGYGATSIDAGWTQDQQFGYTTPANGMLDIWATNTSDNTPSITDGAQAWAGIAAEIQFAAVTTNVPPPSPPGNGPYIAATNNAVGSGSAAPSLTAPAGALLVVSAANENRADATAIAISSSPALTWTTSVTNIAPDTGACSIHTALFAAGGAITVTATATARCSAMLYALTNVESSLAGSKTIHVYPQSSPDLTNTTTRADSLLICVSSDYSAISGTATFRDSAVAALDDDQSGIGAYRGYHYFKTTTDIGAYREGLTAPTGMAAGTCILEVRKP